MAPANVPELVERGRRVLLLEAEAIGKVAARLGPQFAAAVDLLKTATGRVVVSGLGKSGLIAQNPPAKHIHDELHARCLVLDDGTTRIALVVPMDRPMPRPDVQLDPTPRAVH